jgi:hypothetical protein
MSESFARMKTQEFRRRLMKITGIPILFYLWKLDTDPYDMRKKFYLFNRDHEWRLGQMAVDLMVSGENDEKVDTNEYHNGSDKELLLNDILQ